MKKSKKIRKIKDILYKQRKYICSLTGEVPPKKGDKYYNNYVDITLKRELDSFYYFKSGTYLLTGQYIDGVFSFIIDIYVEKRWRRKGIGSRLLKRCGENVILECAKNNPALEWYLKRGFAIVRPSSAKGCYWLVRCEKGLEALALDLVEELSQRTMAE